MNIVIHGIYLLKLQSNRNFYFVSLQASFSAGSYSNLITYRSADLGTATVPNPLEDTALSTKDLPK